VDPPPGEPVEASSPTGVLLEPEDEGPVEVEVEVEDDDEAFPLDAELVAELDCVPVWGPPALLLAAL
jgi:hypothetical protein